jgi:PAS domain S-box-containing protein
VFDISTLKSIIPNGETMKINTAFCFVISGFIYLLLKERTYEKIAIVLSILLVAFALVTLIQDLFSIDLGIDQWIMADSTSIAMGKKAGRMAESTSFSFIVLGIVFLIIKSQSTRLKLYAQYAAHIISLISFIALIGYILNVPSFYRLSILSSMPLHTVFGFLFLSVALTLINPHIGLTGLFTGSKIGNSMARRLFPVMAVTIVILSLIRIELHRHDLINVEFGIALFALSFIIVSLFSIAWTSKQLNISDENRTKAEIQLVMANQNLGNTVAEKTKDLQRTIETLKIQEEILWKNEHLLKEVINNSDSAIFVKDRLGKYIIVNNAFSQNFDKSPESMIGLSAFDIFSPQLATELIADEKFIYESEESVIRDVKVPSKGGKSSLLTSKFALFDEHNTIYAICGISTDITQLEKTKEELELLTDQLQRQNKQLLNFAHITSHNLRSPVSNLNSLLHFYRLSTDSADKEMLFSKFEIVIHHLSTTLNDLIEALKIKEDVGKELELLSFEDILTKTKETFAGTIMETESIITADFSKAPTIEYPKSYLESILLNLLSNAMKYQSPLRKPKIHFETATNKEEIILLVTDNGLGIDLEKYGSKIFGLNKTFHRHAEAKGVGLFIIKTQIEAMGGTIALASEVDKGTTFKITFNSNKKEYDNKTIYSLHN